MLAGRYQAIGLKMINALARLTDIRVESKSYGSADRQRYDCYRQLNNPETGAHVVFIYGGNWRSGFRSDYRFVADTLASAGHHVYIPDYRLYPQVKFADILSDICAAVDAILDQETDAPVYLMGHSAGAQLGALLALNSDLLKANGRIAGFIGLAGLYDFFPFTQDDHWDLFAPDYEGSQAVNFVRPNAPPLYLLHGYNDTRVPRGNSKSLLEKQLATGGIARREVYEKIGHVDIILSFSRLYRGKSPVVADVQRFIEETSAGIVESASETSGKSV